LGRQSAEGEGWRTGLGEAEVLDVNDGVHLVLRVEEGLGEGWHILLREEATSAWRKIAGLPAVLD
jgi:hypothetical protein